MVVFIRSDVRGLTYYFLFCYIETFHMIDKCDSSIATWSESGDNFVVKNIEKFAGVSLCDLKLLPTLYCSTSNTLTVA